MRRFRAFRALIVAQRIVPFRIHFHVAVGVTSAELLLGATVVALIATGVSGTVAGLALISMAVLFSAFAFYLIPLVVRRTSTPCGCFSDALPPNPAVILRAIVFAGAAMSAGFASLQSPGPWSLDERLGQIGLGALAAMLALVLPHPSLVIPNVGTQ
jgi:hypothetical protein